MNEELTITEKADSVSVSMEDVLSVFANYSEKKRMLEIKKAVLAKLTPSDVLMNLAEEDIYKQVEELIRQDKKKEQKSDLIYSKGKYCKRKNVLPPPPPGTIKDIYLGKAGECAVLSELIFNEYNANMMVIDEGVDIVAVKNNNYYYVQVKTTVVKANGNIVCQIDNNRFNQFAGLQIRYVVVARYKDKKKDQNLYFTFSHSVLDNAIYQRCVKRGTNCVSIKIKFDAKTGEPMLYDEQEMRIGYYMNNFELQTV